MLRRPKGSILLVAAMMLIALHAGSFAAERRIGFLSPATAAGTEAVLFAFRQGLREQGYDEGPDVIIESRFANGRFDRLPGLARELIDLKVDVLAAFVTEASIAAKANSKTIPVVMIGVGDPVASGLVMSLARPGGNVTGTSGMFSEAAGKRLELLYEMLPGMRHVAVLWNPANRVFQSQMLEETRASARVLGIEVHTFEARDLASIEKAFFAIAKGRVSALNVLPDPLFASHFARIAALAANARLPSIAANSTYAASGGLMTYGPSIPELSRAAGVLVARILKGAKPADLPVERPTKFELVINKATAQKLGLTIPPSVQLRADRLIE